MAPLPLQSSSTAIDQSQNKLALSFLLPIVRNLSPPSLPLAPATSRTVSPILRRQAIITIPNSLPTVVTVPTSLQTVVTTPTSAPTVVAIPTTYSGLNSGPAPGTVVGIVLGSVFGFLLILWLIYTCFNMQGGGNVEAEEVVRRRSRSPRSTRRSVSRSEVIEVSRHRSPDPPPRRESSRRETVIIEETRRPIPRDDDIVEVIEEHSPSPRRARRSSGRQSGYRNVEPALYGGGDRPVRKVSRR